MDSNLPRGVVGPSHPRSIALMLVLTMAVTLTGAGLFLIEQMRSSLERHLIDGVERRSELAAAQLGNGVFLFLQQLGGGPDDLRNGEHALRKFNRPIRSALAERIRALVERTTIVKVKLYTRDGTTAFSTSPEDIGLRKYSPSFDAALTGRTATEINRRARFSGLGGPLSDVVLAASYMPIRWDASPTPAAVLETYTDVTAEIDQIGLAVAERARQLAAGLALFLLAIVGTAIAAIRFMRRAGLADREPRLAKADIDM